MESNDSIMPHMQTSFRRLPTHSAIKDCPGRKHFAMKKHTNSITPRQDGIRQEDIARVRREMAEAGISQAAWGRANGFTRQQVADVLTGRRLCLRGASHAVAVALGLKKGTIINPKHFRPARRHQGVAA
jgi:gp16 family phage-associated protein